MERRGCWVIRKIRSGRLVEKSKVWVPGTKKPRSGRVKGHTSAEKRDQNANAAVKVLNRLLLCNFSKTDIFLTLKYDDAHLPTEAAQVKRDGENFLRRLIRGMERLGAPKGSVKRIMVVADKDPDEGTGVRFHMHIPVTGYGLAFRSGEWFLGDRSLNGIWGKGSVYAEPMREQADYTALAVYLIRQAVNGENVKKYYPSRNMKKPEVTESIALTGAELRVPKGANIRERKYDALGGQNYVRYILPEKGGRTELSAPTSDGGGTSRTPSPTSDGGAGGKEGGERWPSES